MVSRFAPKNRALKAISSSIMLDSKKKTFWRKQIEIMPDYLLEKLIKVIEENNDTMNKYINVALDNDPEQKYLKKLKQDFKKIKTKVIAMCEEKDKKRVDSDLEEKINKL